jgi:multiple sugar transport system permease protein
MKPRVRQRDFLPAVGFLLPNFVGFVVFTAGPVLFSLGIAFTNWDLQRTEPFQWVGLGNFAELLDDKQFWLYFLNTVYFMLGVPIAIAGSLLLAILLTQRLRGIVAYRTLFYLPTFTSGVALMILWKALYNRDFGPINAAINWVLRTLGIKGVSAPAWLNSTSNPAGLAIVVLGVLFLTAVFLALRKAAGRRARTALYALLFAGGAALLVFLVNGLYTLPVVLAGSLVAMAGFLALGILLRREVASHTLFYLLTLGSVLLFAIARPVAFAAGLGVEEVGLSAGQWGLGARDALIIMGVWIAIGGSNMLLYLAALSNVPQELYEAAQIDGAARWATFCHVTWPQLAPTTFFIVVMSFIGGLQGGFEQARVMTYGGPAGTTTTLVYYIYTKAFEEFQIGYASAVSWVLFTIIFAVTLVNWKFGSKELSY